MRLVSLVAMTAGLCLFLAVPALEANESVSVVSNLDHVTARFGITFSDANSEILSLDIPAIALTPVTLDSKEYQQVSIPGAEYLTVGEIAEDGKPDMPSLSTMLIIPDQAGISLTITYSGYDDIDNIDLAPVQPSPAESDPDLEIPFTKDDIAYSQDAFYPGELAQAAEPVIMRDIRAAQIAIYPLQYNPVSKILRVYRDLSISISYEGAVVNPKEVSRPYLSEAFYPVYKSYFANFDEVFGTAEIRRGGYVIICKQQIADSLKAVAMWKHQKGYTTRIVRTTEINSNGSPTMTQIFNYIQNAYQTWEIPPEYVMLVGDVDGALAINDYPYQSYPSDQKYACVDGSDYIPDLFIGRMSVDNILQTRLASSKIIKYDKTPFMGDPTFWTRGLAVGYNYFETARTLPLWARELALRHGYTQVDTIIQQVHNPNLVNYYANGLGLSWYRGVASSDGWWGPSFTINDLNALPNNQKLGVVVPITCAMADFSTNECFGEIWIRMGMNPDSLKGGPSFYSSSDHYSHTRWNNPNITGFFWGLFEEGASHMGAASLSGKMQIYRTFPRYIGNGSYVQIYFNSYNIIGDPETEIRTAIPILLTVTHPDSIAFGLNHLELNVLDTAGNAIPDAFVTLIKTADSTEEVFSSDRTDAMGNTSLSFNAMTPGDMILTVSGRNLYLYQGHIELVADDQAVGYFSASFSDDSLGYSSGNGDSLANPNETLEFYLALKNFGNSQTANAVSATISAIDENTADIFEPTQYFGDLAPEESRACQQPFVIHLRPTLNDGQTIRLKVATEDNQGHSWNSEFEIAIIAPKLTLNNIAIYDSNNRLDRGDTVQVVIFLTNQGHALARSVDALLTSDDDFISILSGNGSFGDIAVDSTASNLNVPLVISADGTALPGRTVHFSLRTSTLSGYEQIMPFQITVDSTIQHTDPTGPDAYGYYMYDNHDSLYSECPAYNWMEIVPGLGGQGQRLDFGSHTDDYSVLVTLPFDFKYYGEVYQALIVSCNGFVAPDTYSMDMQGNYWSNFFNAPIPDPGNARAQISPFWDDLSISNSGNYGIFAWNDTTGHRFIIEWNHATNRNTSAVETFQMVIYDPAFYSTLTGDADILFQYNTINDNDTDECYASVGIENWDQNIGLQYLFDHTPSPGARTLDVHPAAIMVTTNTGLGGIRGNVDLLGSDSDAGAIIRTSQGQHRTTSDSGSYWLTNLHPGTASLIAEARGYLPQSSDDILVTANQTISDIDFVLQPCPIPTNLAASDSLTGRVELSWNPVSHPNFMGYYIYRSHWPDGEYVRLNLNPVLETHYTDTTLPDTATYWYYVSAIYSNNQWVAESFGSEKDHGAALALSIAEALSPIPSQYFLSQNYPNPFNPTTTISYGLPQASHVRLDIFNITGQRVATLIDSEQPAGYKKVIWNGCDAVGHQVSSGIYLYRMTVGDHVINHKMMLIK